MLTNSQKEHLTYTVIGQIITLVALGIWTTTYIVPGLDKIGITISDANAQVLKYQSTEKDGLTLEEISGIINTRPEYGELLKVISTDVSGTREVLKKTNPEKSYLEWVKESIGSSTEEKNAIDQYKVKLNSIIPTLSPISGGTEEDNLDLKKYIGFIENRILKQFNLDANLVLGMQGVNSRENMPDNMGALELQISFKSTNKDISNFIKFINQSGNPDILISTGVIAKDKTPTIMSNPLITIKSFGLTKPILDKSSIEENQGRITLEFYIRGISKDDITYLREYIKIRNEELGVSIGKAIEECNLQGILCGEVKNRLELLNKKYTQFNLSNTETSNIDNVSQMYNLSKKVSTLKSFEDELTNITESASK